MPKVDVHKDVEHDHNKVVVEDCSTSWSSEDEDDGYESDASQAHPLHHIPPCPMVTARYLLEV